MICQSCGGSGVIAEPNKFGEPENPVQCESCQGFGSVSAVVHCKKQPFDVYIGRPSKWGNPFAMIRDSDRPRVIREYEAWIRNQPELMSSMHELKGKTLGCWCHPKPCHGDILVKLLREQGL